MNIAASAATGWTIADAHDLPSSIRVNSEQEALTTRTALFGVRLIEGRHFPVSTRLPVSHPHGPSTSKKEMNASKMFSPVTQPEVRYSLLREEKVGRSRRRLPVPIRSVLASLLTLVFVAGASFLAGRYSMEDNVDRIIQCQWRF